MSTLIERLQRALGDSYTVVRELGGGGMSRVFVAEELELGRKVVVKVLPPEMAAGVNADRFRREIQLAASLQHPHIVPLLRAGRADDLVWYTMPLVSGESLRAKLAREGELPVPEVVRIMRDVVSALAYAHSNGVVHRDIKPDNILLSQGFAVVTDFGVAKAVSEATGESSLTSLGVALGTPAYMAPEQASADPHTDHRADIYALGVLGYEMLSGSPPFVASSPQMVLAAHVTQAPAAITQHRTAVPGALAAMVMRCLEKKPADRWQSASELYQQLDAMATPSGGMAPTAAVPSISAAAQSVHRPRNVRLMLAAAAVIVAVGAAAFVVPRIGGNESASVAAARPMLVVLPFQNLGSADDQYFADGMTEEITSRLAALGGLGVISRTSAIQYRDTDKPLRQIGEELNVGYVLEGTIRWDKRADGSSRVRVSPQLIKVSDDTHLWAQTYDAELKEVFTVQSDIAGQVAQALNVTLLAKTATEEPPTANIEAYQYYLRGNEYRNRGFGDRDIRAAVDQYERAVALDPGFAVAHAQLSSAHSMLFWFYHDRTEQRLEEARRAVQRAFAADPDLPEAHIAQGLVHYWGSRDYSRALASFDVARKSKPNNADLMAATAYVLRRQGKWQEAASMLEQAAALDPRATTLVTDLGTTYDYMRDYDRAARWYDHALTLSPDEVTALAGLARIRAIRAGGYAPSHKLIAEMIGRLGPVEAAERIVGNGLFNMATLGGPAYQGAVVALPVHERSNVLFLQIAKADAFTELGDAERARAYFDSTLATVNQLVRERPDDPGFRTVLGMTYSGLGRHSDALRETRRAVELLPLERDALDGANYLETYAQVQVAAGDLDSAIASLQRLLEVPSIVNAELLRFDPRWAPLRSHPRFQQLLVRR